METNESSYDSHKVLSLKLACLSWRDRFWILSKLPGEERKRLKQSIKFVRKLGKGAAEQLLNNINAQQESLIDGREKEALVTQDTNATAMSFCCPHLKQQVQKIKSQEVQVTELVRQLLTEGTLDVSN